MTSTEPPRGGLFPGLRGPSGARLSSWCHAAIWAGVLLVSLYVHLRAGLTFPNPWNDEAWNLWQAKALVQTGTFNAPELNPDHPSMLYGGGYAAAVGGFMRMFGFTLETARHFSWLCLAGVWSLTALVLAGWPWRSLWLALSGLFFLAPVHVVTANVARPGALVLLIVTLGYWRLSKGAPLQAIFLCGLGVIVHPNALYFLLGALAYVGLAPELWPRVRRPTRTDGVVMALCAVPVLLSGWMILRIWEHWVGFFRIQLEHNATYGPAVKLAGFRWWLVGAAGGALAARGLRLPAAIWLVYGLAALLAALLGGEMWYEVYKLTGLMTLLAGGPVVLWQLGRRLGARWPSRPLGRACAGTGWILAAVCLLALLEMNLRHGFLVGPRNYPRKLSWGVVMADPGVPYVTPNDKRIVAELAVKAAGDHPAPIVEFPGTGDSFLFIEALPRPARPRLAILTATRGQVAVFHLSRYLPPMLAQRVRAELARWSIDEAQPDYERDGTEKWYVRPVAPAGP